ncbi:EAL domain-containing protein [Bordetella sp. FB-8]|uniref:sensor domain-containing protein n=1 Tax=Bordetella sp. FB-8 TaxID=1159870 RepID=UPI00037656BB|nr:EAL domain-containing protein [Bordetella sp. FB-8]
MHPTRVSSEFLRSLIESSNDAIVSKTLGGIITSWNPAAEKMFGYTAEEMIGQSVKRLFPAQLRDEEDHIIAQIAAGKRVEHFETVRLRKDGSTFPVSVTVSPIRDESGIIIAASKIVRDITLRRTLEDQMRLSETVFNFATEAIIVADADGRFIHVNKAFTQITGYGLEDVIGKTPAIFRSSRQAPEIQLKMLGELKATGYCQGEIWSRKKTGEALAVLINISRVQEQDHLPGRHIAVFADITGLREQQELMERMAHFDSLTDLPNRLLLAERLERSLLRAEKEQSEVAVAYLDLDGFKDINDHYGHAVGDEVLATVGRRMASVLRDSDTVARVGGDEFVLLIESRDAQEEYLGALHRVLQICKEPMRIRDRLITLSASVGITVFPRDASDPDVLVRHADLAMYEAKQSGRDRMQFFDPEQDKKAKQRYELIKGVSRALENQELFLEYQPKVDIVTGKIYGAEALIRWRTPDGQVIYPGDFIPLIEDMPIIDEVGDYVIQRALVQIEKWFALGHALCISVNIAPHHFLSPTFASRLRELTRPYRDLLAGRKLLEIEIIETQKFLDLHVVSTIMQTCANMGIGFSLDDFGTGYSSLLYLKELPAETIKIDQSFVAGMADNQHDLFLVRAILGLAQAFRREVIAEGVETKEQARMLVDMGCSNVQGYGVAPPMTADKFEQWCGQWQDRISPDLLQTGLAFPGL